MERLRVALLFGGRSAEHDVSVMSARNVFRALDPERYETVAIGIDRAGAWRLCSLEGGAFPAAVPEDGRRVALVPAGAGRLAVLSGAEGAPPDLSRAVDVVFPVLHGPFGEDGTVQGAAEIAGVAYVGSGVLGSAVAMDKDVAKRLMRDSGLPNARFLSFARGDAPAFERVAAELGRPLFVKPARLGSSVGVSKAGTREEFAKAIVEAFRHDRKILVEEYVRGREIECGVLEGEDGSLIASLPGEIVPSNRHGFYTYEAKYLDDEGATIKVPADLPGDVSDKVRKLAIEAFRALSCEGLARVDFFLRDDGALVINEVNTLPGFTNISMYPKMFEAMGVSYPELVDRLIRHALARAGGRTDEAANA
ncbi:MAG TPA: D-alanine--D-alanine ligase family protein [Roseiarcus sp.]|nr:D-alanine--D-alanine ligase family protein [Roseiarcus sp.]